QEGIAVRDELHQPLDVDLSGLALGSRCFHRLFVHRSASAVSAIGRPARFHPLKPYPAEPMPLAAMLKTPRRLFPGDLAKVHAILHFLPDSPQVINGREANAALPPPPRGTA